MVNFFPINQIQSWFNNWQWRRGAQNFFVNQVFNASTPVYVDVEKSMIAYMDCPHLNVVVNKGAELFSNGRWIMVDTKDESITYPDDPILTLLNNPNPIQNSQKWLYQYYFYRALYSNNFIYKLQGTTTSPIKCLWHLPSDWMTIKLTGKFYNQYDIKGIIEYYELMQTAMGLQEKFQTETVIYDSYNFSPIEGKGISKVRGLKLPISNIVASLKTRNILMTEKGMIGILSNQAKDNSGGIPLSKDERLRIENDFQNQKGLYGTGSHISVTNASLTWQPMSFPTRDLLLFEEIEDDFATIISAFGLDRDIFPSLKGATYENKNAGEKSSYQNGIQPIAYDLANTLTKEFKLEGKRLCLDYSYLPIMKEDELKEAQAEKVEIDGYSVLYNDGVITLEQYADLTDQQYIPIEKETLTEAQNNLRGLVGSVSGIMQINQFVAQGIVDKITAVNILMSVYGYDQPTATGMITNNVIPITQPIPSVSIPTA
ncbi:portal_HK97, phage portal protein, HK97 family [uncultured Caudovirales phage]|uniref:Portal_HK97, phage portal protein, HK97 family n=1 Tax=uncultured Caudovirales phage TaxID=2100421 RepID=A0A6J5MLX9_9CAUD|nr:portal_HK97, phage portal protein, HK97 family [uncultured Caudovirales phage]